MVKGASKLTVARDKGPFLLDLTCLPGDAQKIRERLSVMLGSQVVNWEGPWMMVGRKLRRWESSQIPW